MATVRSAKLVAVTKFLMEFEIARSTESLANVAIQRTCLLLGFFAVSLLVGDPLRVAAVLVCTGISLTVHHDLIANNGFSSHADFLGLPSFAFIPHSRQTKE